MLTILNNYQHGFVAIPVVLACRRHGLFELCQVSAPLSFDVLVKELRANSGHLRVALHMLVSIQWLSHDDGDRYTLTPLSKLHRHIPEDITSLLSFPMHEYVSEPRDRLSLETWVEVSGRRWNIQDPAMAHFLDGLLMIPLLLALRERSQSQASHPRGESLFTALPPLARAEIVTLLAGKGWLDYADRPLSKGGPILNEAGRFMIDRSLITATVASYRPMLTNIAEVIFGNCVDVFRRDAAGHETHVDRTLNVVGSGFQHERYFDQMEEAILAVFNREPYEDQPRYVADMGCGDGTLLRTIYDLIKTKSSRGKVLERYPVKLIGVDYNAQALEATTRTLAGYEYLVLQGDIGDPARLIEGLRAQGIQDPEHILHVRSFLDHDRPYKPPLDHTAAQARAHLAYHGVYVDREGNSLPPAAVVQSLVEHLRGWSSIIGHHGLMILEVHCLEPRTIARFMPQCESLHMDAYHRFSQQLLVEADRFVMAAQEVGLCPDWEFFKKYPSRHPYTRITLSYLRKCDYTIRHPNEADVPALVAFERRCLPEFLVASVEEIRQRIACYPEGQCLLEVDGQLAAVAYSQRVSREVGPDERGEATQLAWAHTDDGAVAELLYALSSSTGQKTHGHDLVTFMTNWLALKDGVETVTGAARCERYLDRSAHGLEWLMANVRDYMQCYAIGPEADTRAPETELSAFGTRWLLRIFQDMGVMTAPHQVYDLKNLIQRLGILPKYERLGAALARLLAREQVLHIAGDRIEVMPLASTFALQDVAAEYARFSAEFTKNYATYQPFLELMCRCLKQFAAVLTGTVAVNDVIFPHGSMDVFAGLFHRYTVADSFNDLVAEIVLANITLARQHAPEARLSILEVGAGTGSTTRVVLEKIQHLAGVLAFHYTDISSAFTRYGEKTFGEQFPWVKFHRLNIEEDLIAQGFQSESFDLIYAANTLHDTRNIAHTLAQVKTLLKPGGLLVVNEFTAMKDVLLFTGGLLHGYWLFEDPELRLQDSCLLGVDRWREVLTVSGFQHVEALGLPFEAIPSGQSVIIGAKSGHTDAARESAQGVPTLTDRATVAVIEAVVREVIGPKRLASLTPDTPLMESGLDSMELLDLRMLLSKKFGVDLDAIFLFQQNTLRKVSAFFQQGSQPAQQESNPGPPQNALSAENVVFQVSAPPDTPYRHHDIAIIGMALRLPGHVHTPDDLWRLLQAGETAIGTMSEERWSWLSEPAPAADKPYLRQGGFLQRIDEFDAAFFRISPREAELLDPQQRLLLELGWEVMEDAGYKPSLLSGSDTGVFIGACHFDYHRLLEEHGMAAEALAATGTGGSILANRLSYFYNFQGPSMVIDTACSSSLMAVHTAVRALRDGSCDQALVGGVNLICHATNTLSYDKAGMLSEDGTCYTFDARANGYVRGEGAALVFLKRLDRAIQDHDRIYAVIRGSAVNHGGQASSLTAPNPAAQAHLLVKAWQDAEVAANSVTYIEAHGTGTPLGDPIEVEGIRQAIAQSHSGGFQDDTCGLGSLKANIGHLEGAAGIAGLIKVLLCLQHQMLPKSINFEELNPEIKLTAPLYIVGQTQPWQALRDQAGVAVPRRAGVSSFGFGGANAHVVLEEFPQAAGDRHVAGPYVFVLSARDQSRLLAYAERFLEFLERPQAAALSLPGMTYTLQNGREEMDARLAILFTDLAQLREKLQRFCVGQQAVSDLYHGNAQRSAAEYDLLTAGPAGRAFIQQLIAERDYERLALLWVRGACIEWPALFGHQPPAKVRLPTYPFARDRFWVPQTRAEEATSASPPGDRMQALHRSTSCPAAADQGAVDHGSNDKQTLILTPVWASVSRATFQAIQPSPAAVDRVMIVYGDGETAVEEGTAYRHALQQRYPEAHLLLIRPGDTIDTMARTIKELSARLGGALDHIFWIVPGPGADPGPIVRRDLLGDQRQGVIPLFRTIKALLRVGYGTRPLGWTLITMRAQPIHQQDSIDPTHAGVHGLIGSLAKELPHWQTRLIDLDAPCDLDGREADLLLDDLLILPPDPEGNAWACRGFTDDGAPRWFRQQLVPMALPEVSRSLYRSAGVYVVIGGAGGVGEVWSEYMLRTYSARIVWINRRPKDLAVQAKLDRLARLGPMPDYISADATDEAALLRAYEDIKARYGQINGVVHAAVVLLDQSLVHMDEARFLAGLAAKVDTSVQMARVFQREPLDFVLFFSSIMTFLKPPGQANYTAGCTFQDAFVHQLGREWSRPQRGTVVKVMHWGYWGSIGVAASETYRERMAKAGLGSIDSPEAMAALEALLAGPFDRLAQVKTMDPTMLPFPEGEGTKNLPQKGTDRPFPSLLGTWTRNARSWTSC